MAAQAMKRSIYTASIAALAVALIRSGWIVVSSLGVHGTLSALDITLLRFVSAALVTTPLLYKMRGNLAKIFNLRVILCSLGWGFPYALASFWGLASSTAAAAGIIVHGLLPIINAGLICVWTKKGVPRIKVFGIVMLCVANAIMLSEGGAGSLGGALWLLLATACLSFYSVSMSVWNIPLSTMLVAVPWVNALFFLPIWLCFPSHLFSADKSDIVLQVLYQGVIMSVVSLALLGYAITVLGAVSASMWMAFVPSITSLLALTVLGQSLSPLAIASVGLCTLGIFVYSLSDKTELFSRKNHLRESQRSSIRAAQRPRLSSR